MSLISTPLRHWFLSAAVAMLKMSDVKKLLRRLLENRAVTLLKLPSPKHTNDATVITCSEWTNTAHPRLAVICRPWCHIRSSPQTSVLFTFLSGWGEETCLQTSHNGASRFSLLNSKPFRGCLITLTNHARVAYWHGYYTNELCPKWAYWVRTLSLCSQASDGRFASTSHLICSWAVAGLEPLGT